jgi:ceramide glucosyltransferase
MMWILGLALAAVLAGSWVFCVLTVVAVRKYLAVRPAAQAGQPISVLKPLDGLDEGLEENLRSFFEQDYGEFELLFAAREASDPSLALVERLRGDYPGIPVRVFVTGEPPYPNAKVWSLQIMMAEARNDLLVMSDSDIRAGRDLLRGVAAEFADPGLGVATCPYRAVPGRSFWSTMEAVGMNTEFWGGAIVARMVEGGVKFAVGPTIAARRRVVEAVGGWPKLAEYLAEDFVLGQFAANAGHGVILSSQVVEHRIGAQAWRPNFAHRLRWNRSTRRSRPAGYVGQVFTNPFPISLLLLALLPQTWPLALITLVLRGWAAYEVSQRVLADPLCRRRPWLVLVQDVASFVFWVAGFHGDTITWRSRRYRLLRDGRFELRREA